MTRQIPLFAQDPIAAADLAPATALAPAIAHFARHLARQGKSAHTVSAFRSDLNLLIQFAGQQARIGEMTTARLNAFLDWMENERGVPCSRKTYARRVTALKVFFKWLAGLDALAYDPAQAIRQRSGPAPLSHVVSAHEIALCHAAARAMKKGAAPDWRPPFLFQLLLEAGLKKAETARLDVADFDGDARQIHIRHKGRDVYKERRIHASAELFALLDRYNEQYAPDGKAFTCTARNLEYILTDIGERAGLAFKLSFEVMRWSSAVRDHRARVEDDQIRAKLGLSRISWYETGDKVRRLAAQLQASEDAQE